MLKTALVIRPLDDTPELQSALATLLIDTVAGGASVSFMHPLSFEQAQAFWSGALASAARGERVVLGAFDGETLVGTVSVVLDMPPNQPHRAEIAKLMTCPSRRGEGVGAALMQAAEAVAVSRGRSLLVLDTAAVDGAGPLYEKLGFVFAGEIPDFALLPRGGLSATRLYWKRVGEMMSSESS